MCAVGRGWAWRAFILFILHKDPQQEATGSSLERAPRLSSRLPLIPAPCPPAPASCLCQEDSSPQGSRDLHGVHSGQARLPRSLMRVGTPSSSSQPSFQVPPPPPLLS